MAVMYSESIIETIIIHKKQINASVLVDLMNSGWRSVQILKWRANNETQPEELEWINKRRERERFQRISRPLWFPPKTALKEWGLLQFLRQKVWNNYKPRIRGRALLEASFFNFQLNPFSVLALIFEPIKLRQERALQSAVQGREMTAVIGQILKSVDHIKTWSKLSDVLVAVH